MNGIEVISLRDTLEPRLVEFLRDEGMPSPHTAGGLVELVNLLSLYHEEGHAVSPKVFIFNDINTVKTIPNHENILIGEGPKQTQTFRTVLKKCAPLAQRGWVIYILEKKESYEFGLIKNLGNTLSLTIEEILIETGETAIPVVMAHQIFNRNVKITGTTRRIIYINFGADSDEATARLENLHSFLDSLITDVPDDSKEQTNNFYDKLFTQALSEGHGMLALVIPCKEHTIPKKLKDSTKLKSPICISQRINELLSNKDNVYSNDRVESYTSIIMGMLLSDGITIFNSQGDVLAFRSFVKHSAKDKTKEITGGARSRTFFKLKDMVANREILSAFMQSQDGAIFYEGVTK